VKGGAQLRREIPISHEEIYLSNLLSNEFVPLYKSWRNKVSNGAVYAVLSPIGIRSRVTGSPSWQIHVGEGQPCFSTSGFGAAEVATYHAGDEDGLVPLAFIRDGHGVIDSHPEPLQEFILFHDLLLSNNGREYLKVHTDGSTEVAIKITSSSEIQTRSSLIRQFQAAKQMDLVFQIDSVQFVDDKSELPEESETSEEFKNLGTFLFDSWSSLGYRTLGKIVYPPAPLSESGIWPFEINPHITELFTIRTQGGQIVEVTLNSEEHLDPNEYLRKQDRHFLEIVEFDKNVLNRYLANPDKYIIGDGVLKCGSLWSISIDNDDSSNLFIFLGDLLRDLPPSEWKYWKPFNQTSDKSVSETFFKRSILGKEVEPNRPDLRFRGNYAIFQDSWSSKFDWMLFTPMTDEDAYVLNALHLPNTESNKGFDDFFLYLGKLLPNSINISKLNQLTGIPKRDRSTNLERFALWLKASGFQEHEFVFNTLHAIQWIRSHSSAHPKDAKLNNLLRSKFGMQIGYELAEKLCNDANETLNLLDSHFL
jgi:hypothetical protein